MRTYCRCAKRDMGVSMSKIVRCSVIGVGCSVAIYFGTVAAQAAELTTLPIKSGVN